MAGRTDYLQRAPTQVNLVAIVQPARNVEWFSGGVRLRIEPYGQGSANFVWGKFRLRVFFRAAGVGPRKVRIHAVHIAKSPVVPNVVVVSMRVHHAHRKFGQSCNYGLDIADTHAGVEQQRFVIANDQIRDDLFQLMGLINGKYAGANLIHLEPRICVWNTLQLAVGRTRQVLAPLCLLSSQRRR